MKSQDIFNDIINEFANELKHGKNPLAMLSRIVPTRGTTGDPYTGANRLFLGFVLGHKGYSTGRFMTFKQICEKGGAVKAGEKGTPVFYFNRVFVFKRAGEQKKVTAFTLNEAKDICLDKYGSGWTCSDNFPFIKHYYVFNLEQADGIEYDDERMTPLKSAEAVIAHSGIPTVTGNGLPRYDGASGVVVRPEINLFEGEESYPFVFQALIKATAVPLERELPYAEEALVAAIGGAFLSASCGLESAAVSADAIDGILEKLGKSPMFLYKAANMAQTAVDMILGHVVEEIGAAA